MPYSAEIIQNRINEIRKSIAEQKPGVNCFERMKNVQEECKDECVIVELERILQQIEVAEREGMLV